MTDEIKLEVKPGKGFPGFNDLISSLDEPSVSSAKFALNKSKETDEGKWLQLKVKPIDSFVQVTTSNNGNGTRHLMSYDNGKVKVGSYLPNSITSGQFSLLYTTEEGDYNAIVPVSSGSTRVNASGNFATSYKTIEPYSRGIRDFEPLKAVAALKVDGDALQVARLAGSPVGVNCKFKKESKNVSL